MQKKRTFKFTVFISLLVVGLILSGCVGMGTAQSGWSGAVAGSDSVYLGSSDGKLVSLNFTNGFYQWQESLEASSSGGVLGCAGGTSSIIYATPVLNGETVYIGNANGKLYAFNISDRQSKSVILNAEKSGSIIGSPLVYDGSIYVGSTDGSLYAYDAASLTYKWQYNTGGEIWASPANWQDSIIVASFDKKLYSIDSNNGQPNWGAPFEVDGPIIAAPVIYGDTIIVASLDRHIYAVNAKNGQLLWEYPPGENDNENAPKRWLWAAPVVQNDKIYAPSMDGIIYVLNGSNGELSQTIDLDEAIATSPVFAGDHMVVATKEGKIYSIDTTSYQKIELRNINSELVAPLGVSGNTVFAHSVKEKMVYALNGETGALLWSTTLN